jgi:hypothetical protein
MLKQSCLRVDALKVFRLCSHFAQTCALFLKAGAVAALNYTGALRRTDWWYWRLLQPPLVTPYLETATPTP